MVSDLAPRSKQAEWLADLADAAADLGMGIRAVTETSVTLYSGNETTITIESHFLSGRMLRSVLRPRPDPAAAENGARDPYVAEDFGDGRIASEARR